ncbi:virulence RhuM family protein [Olivibacter sp. SDN3]|uniref:virulence RhuM family protein n=1 Tax=Olivibacter sp. SDN3 TaxID=2764720 RepID=UPI0016511C2A|nr:RhuM family protein [Olivibacter sp. SDN3]QNL51885.1 virulence RhuM family protein [Olivibacter sp. SDN3]
MKNQIEIYQASDGQTQIEVTFEQDTVWLDTNSMAAIFEVQRPAIVEHIGNIYKSGELIAESTCSILEQVATDGKKRKINFYNLDMVISVGYRVNSTKATLFRQWATQRLRAYLVSGLCYQ